MKDRGAFSRCICLSRGGLSAAALFCLKQDGQDAQDEQDYRHSPRSNRAPPKTRHQVREDLNVYRLKQEHDAKVREDFNRYRLKQDGQDAQDGQDEGARVGVFPLRNRSGAVTNRAYRQRTREPPVDGDRLIAIGQDRAILPYRNGAEGRQKKRAGRRQTPRAQSMQARLKTAPTVSLPTPLAASRHRTSSTHDWPQRRDRAADASPTSPDYHQRRLPQSDSSIQHPASPMYR